MRKFLLVDKQPIEIDNLLEWARLAERRWEIMQNGGDDIWGVAFDRVGRFSISTVFLGIDHSFGHSGPPLVFETAAFTQDEDVEVEDRYSTWDEAVAGHERTMQAYALIAEVEAAAPGV